MPSDALSETEACELLAKLFRSRGYAIQRNIPFSEYGVSFHIDGWDAKARVGYEFLSSEDEDHDDLTLREYQALMAAQMRGELAIFVIDEVEPLSASELRGSAEEFLDEVTNARTAKKIPVRKKAKKTTAKSRSLPAKLAKNNAANKKGGNKKKRGTSATVRGKKVVKRSTKKKPGRSRT